MSKKLHIVSFDVPFPANYGGVIDVYNRVKALHNTGVEIILHCFEYGRGEQAELYKYCKEVYYYKRKKNPFLLFSKKPFIVSSRKNEKLLNRLLEIDAPILFEGHHTCYYLNDKKLKHRNRLVRAHNIEHEYYSELAKAEPSFLKQVYFKSEARKLKRFDQNLKEADKVLTVSLKEQDYYNQCYGNAYYLPVFNPLSYGEYQINKQDYILFHGNLSVAENDHACHYLIDSIFSKTPNWKFIIAGFQPNETLIEKTKRYQNIKLISSPDNEQLQNLIKEAKVNLLITFQNTGIKHKLLNALSNGGHCIVNHEMIFGTGLNQWCIEANTPSDIVKKIETCVGTNYELELYQKKIAWLKEHFDMNSNAQKLVSWLAK